MYTEDKDDKAFGSKVGVSRIYTSACADAGTSVASTPSSSIVLAARLACTSGLKVDSSSEVGEVVGVVGVGGVGGVGEVGGAGGLAAASAAAAPERVHWRSVELVWCHLFPS